jgi:predicted nucleic acid-binding protein
MNAYVLDTSVAAAWYLPESFQAEARRWQRQLLDGEVRLVVPRLHFQELANVLRTYLRRGELDTDLATEIWELHLDAPLEVIDSNPRHLLATASEYAATAYDAVYIQMALELDLILLTGERTTTPWVVKLGNRVQTMG